jgi:membrane-bound lytic murein transglycosylase MltF
VIKMRHKGTWILVMMVLSGYFYTTMVSPSKAAMQTSNGGDVGTVSIIHEKWTGDFDGMVARRIIRALVVNSKTFYFLDGGRQRGLSYDVLMAFEKYINKKLNNKTIQVHVVFIPVSRDKLLPALKNGFGDIAVANLTITSARQQLVDFSQPVLKDVAELIVTGPAVPKLKGLDDLAGRKVHVRKSSSYYESLLRINQAFRANNKEPLKIVIADENLEDEDLLEMVNAGLLPMVVVDGHKAHFWKQIFSKITVYENIAVRSGGDIGWAFRKDSPRMKAVVNDFLMDHKKGTLIGNILFKRYLKNTQYIENSLSEKEMYKFNKTAEFFRKYAEQYDFDWLMVAAQGYQESQLDQTKISPAGAIGVMQLLPSTATDKHVNIKDIDNMGNNIHAGIKYLRFIFDRYFKNEKMDDLNKTLFSFASYNAGPAKVARLRREAEQMGLDPNVWFNHVEIVAAKRIGRETVQYVSNILKYWVAYKALDERKKSKKESAQRAR